MDASTDKKTSGRYLAVLSLSALGVVYGDIGTSPLYALRECFHAQHGVAATPDNIIGILSLICWAPTTAVRAESWR
jgi:KUP system potassium uptake protein